MAVHIYQFITPELNDEKIEELRIFLAVVYEKGETISFELLETIFEVQNEIDWSREVLIEACRNLYLLGLFDTDFWKGLMWIDIKVSSL